jgi:hypothetical protein
MAPPKKNDQTHNEEIRSYVLTRDKHVCQWPGCGNTTKVEVLFLLETDASGRGDSSFYKNGVTLCPKHLELVNLHDKAFGPLIYDLIQLVEFEIDLNQTEKVYKEILKQ